MNGDLPADFDVLASTAVEVCLKDKPSVASRAASQQAMARLSEALPELIGGSADLTSSNLTKTARHQPMAFGHGGDYIFYGVREFGMAAIMNGLAAHGGFRPFGGTYLTFSDYSRNAIRMAALMKLGVVHVLTHDSIALGQDGPTHQPVEQLASLRLIPNLDVWRPCDSLETTIAWEQAVRNRETPTALVLSRQALPFQQHSEETIAGVRRGGYVLVEPESPLQLVMIATGSEVEIAVSAAKTLSAQGIGTRVVSMPSTFVFDRQDAAYKAKVLPKGIKRMSIEAGSTDYWWKYVGLDGGVLGMDRFGESAPPEALFEHFGLTADAAVAMGQALASDRLLEA